MESVLVQLKKQAEDVFGRLDSQKVDSDLAFRAARLIGVIRIHEASADTESPGLPGTALGPGLTRLRMLTDEARDQVGKLIYRWQHDEGGQAVVKELIDASASLVRLLFELHCAWNQFAEDMPWDVDANLQALVDRAQDGLDILDAVLQKEDAKPILAVGWEELLRIRDEFPKDSYIRGWWFLSEDGPACRAHQWLAQASKKARRVFEDEILLDSGENVFEVIWAGEPVQMLQVAETKSPYGTSAFIDSWERLKFECDVPGEGLHSFYRRVEKDSRVLIDVFQKDGSAARIRCITYNQRALEKVSPTKWVLPLTWQDDVQMRQILSEFALTVEFESGQKVIFREPS